MFDHYTIVALPPVQISAVCRKAVPNIECDSTRGLSQILHLRQPQLPRSGPRSESFPLGTDALERSAASFAGPWACFSLRGRAARGDHKTSSPQKNTARDSRPPSAPKSHTHAFFAVPNSPQKTFPLQRDRCAIENLRGAAARKPSEISQAIFPAPPPGNSYRGAFGLLRAAPCGCPSLPRGGSLTALIQEEPIVAKRTSR